MPSAREEKVAGFSGERGKSRGKDTLANSCDGSQWLNAKTSYALYAVCTWNITSPHKYVSTIALLAQTGVLRSWLVVTMHNHAVRIILDPVQSLSEHAALNIPVRTRRRGKGLSNATPWLRSQFLQYATGFTA